jgi:hypothetical protein
MQPRPIRVSGTATGKGASVLCFGFQWIFHGLGAVWERLAVTWGTGEVGFDHHLIGDDHIDLVFG